MVHGLHVILDHIFHQDKCSLCRKQGLYSSRRPWCSQCQENMDALSRAYPHCDICGKYLCEGEDICTECRQQAPPFSIARSVGPYEGEYRIAVKVFKFLGRRYLCWKIGGAMADVVKNEPRFWPLDIISPVPISNQSLCDRGFDQTEVLAARIARSLKVVNGKNLLERVKETSHQRELSREDREKNLLNAFRVKDPRKVYNKNVLLVDDVYTTGSTVRECTRVLLEAGASKVAVITWASGRGF